MSSESKKIGTLSFILEKDGHPMGVAMAHTFNQLGEEILIQHNGQWYKFGTVVNVHSDINVVMIKLHISG